MTTRLTKILLSILIIALPVAYVFSTSQNIQSKWVDDAGRRAPSKFRFVFWNVENLFDTDNDPNTQDEDFTPEGRNAWTAERYQKKLEHTAKVLMNIPESYIVPLIGLCEIENKKTLDDLLSETDLRNSGYAYIHRESPDERGIDVALLYRQGAFEVLATEWLTVTFDDPKDKTREILYVKGSLMGDTLHVMVNHWPSRREGEKISEPKRMQAAKVANAKVEQIQAENPNAKIVIMGDFNDDPDNKSMMKGLGANSTPANAIKNNGLFNMMYDLNKQGKGTLYFEGQFNLFDQFVVSGDLADPNNRRMVLEQNEGKIFAPDWTTFTDVKTKAKRPNRTFAGSKYIGGFSDHYPVYIDLRNNF
jgi:endonuclease/exonuclease/phosphatase family metal-dependent hydrolase